MIICLPQPIATINHKRLVTSTGYIPIATASEDQKDNDDNENEIHNFLQTCDVELTIYMSLQNNYFTASEST